MRCREGTASLQAMAPTEKAKKKAVSRSPKGRDTRKANAAERATKRDAKMKHERQELVRLRAQIPALERKLGTRSEEDADGDESGPALLCPVCALRVP